MAEADTTYSVRFGGPTLVERGRDNEIRCEVRRSGSLVAPSAGGTVSVFDRSGTAIVDEATITVTASIATYTIADATTSALAFETGWRIEWSLTVDSLPRAFHNDAALVRKLLQPPFALSDLYRRMPKLDPSNAARAFAYTAAELQSFMDEAWGDLTRRLLRSGVLLARVVDPSALTDVLRARTLQLVFEDAATTLGEAHIPSADRYRKEYTSAWREFNTTLDNDQDGLEDSTARRPARPVVFLSGGRSGVYL